MTDGYRDGNVGVRSAHLWGTAAVRNALVSERAPYFPVGYAQAQASLLQTRETYVVAQLQDAPAEKARIANLR
jgi:hypothetical protein